ncbi:hypothetical protein Vau01_066570 [Virgisporangium aurantiacum]|uniref:Uncharacterized protein n=1 Tax=Virgisporangium aurantiacum TaxID=175570 RepID=A0A8J4E2N2_9ACTN|nr:hypothetical protein Vau01_066570 [Virgisporangium aurantiacum]
MQSWAGMAPAPDGLCSRQRMAQLAPPRSGQGVPGTQLQPNWAAEREPNRRRRLATGYPTGTGPGTQLASWVPRWVPN